LKPGLLLLNFGGPQTAEDLEPFLQRLFTQVLPLPNSLKPLIVPRLARARARKVGPHYAQIGWSPIVPDTGKQLEALVQALGSAEIPAAMGMMFSEPSILSAISHLFEQGADGLIALGLFPQYSLETSVPAFQKVADALQQLDRTDTPVHYVRPFFDHPAYLSALADTIRQGVASLPGEGPIHLLFSAHGLPLYVVKKADPYPDQVRETVRAVTAQLHWEDPVHLSWQSRVGPTEWLSPSTAKTLQQLGEARAPRVLVVPVSFVGDHIETLYEIDVELAELGRAAGIQHLGRTPALGTHPEFVACLKDLVQHAMKQFERYACVRCLLPKPVSHRHQGTCPNCRFIMPSYLTLPGSYRRL